MDLIYTNPNLEDVGIIQDYSFDMCYGDRDNTFALKVQTYNPIISGNYPISFGSYIYVDRTEYGGIVDRIESNTKNGEVTISGRTWHGILNGCVLEPETGCYYRTLGGEANGVLAEIIGAVQLTDLFDVDEDDSGIDIESTDIRYGLAYDVIRALFSRANAKLYCYFQFKKVHIGAVLSVNYALSDGFDQSQVPFKVGLTYNNVNHIVCLGGNDENGHRIVIHLFTDEDGNIMPYVKPGIVHPEKNEDYILDTSQQRLFGKKEISYVYSYETAEVVYNHRLLTSKPAGWNTSYPEYYKGEEDTTTHEMKFTKLKRTYGIRMDLLTSEPEGWRDKNAYKNYYYMTDADHYQSIQELPDSKAEMMFYPQNGYETQPVDWNDQYTDYWYPDITAQSGYTQLTEQTQDIYYPYNVRPTDWTWNWSAYYTRAWDGTKWVYSSVAPKRTYTYDLTTKKPTNWTQNWSNYYVKITEVAVHIITFDGPKRKRVIDDIVKVENHVWEGTIPRSETYGNTQSFVNIGISRWATIREAIDLKVPGLNVKNGVPKWHSFIYYLRIEHQSAPEWPTTADTIFYKYSERIVPPFEANKYYRRILNKVPPFKTVLPSTHPDYDPDFKGYWEKVENVEKIPEWNSKEFYIRYEDRCKSLIEWGLKKLDELRDTSTIDIDLNLGSGYDVGDIVGATDKVMKRICEETERQVEEELETGPRRPILRKIIKIKKDIVSISYEVN